MESGSGLLGETPVDRNAEVCASISSKELVSIHLLPPDARDPVGTSLCGLFVLLAEVLYPPWWDRANCWTWWWEVSVGFIKNQNPCGITQSSAASCVCFKCGTISLSGERGLMRMDYLMLYRNQPNGCCNSCADLSLGHMFLKCYCPLQLLFPPSPYWVKYKNDFQGILDSIVRSWILSGEKTGK